MKTNLPMVLKQCLLKVCLLAVALAAPAVMAATTSWIGTNGTGWATANNWTAGVPSSTVDAIIGDANFIGGSQPTISSISAAACLSLTVGTGAISATLTVDYNLKVYGNITIGTNGIISHTATPSSRDFQISGNWTNLGAYNATTTEGTVGFVGTTQFIGGTNVTAFQRLTIDTSSTTTLATNCSVTTALSVKGTLDPGAGAGLVVSGAGTMTVTPSGTVRVRATTFDGNYSIAGKTLNAGSTVDYAANGDQTITNLTYSTLRISGSGVKTITNNLSALRSNATTNGIIDVASGTLDLSRFTANRDNTSAGGTVSVAAGATLKIGGTNSFPTNYATHSLAATSTVEYYGTNQTVTAEAYGNLTLSSSGTATKTMPGSALTIAGNLVSATNAPGASVSFTAGGALTVNGNLTLGAGTTFNGASFTHNVGTNWVNNGATFTPGTSTINFNGTGAQSIGGSSSTTFNNLSVNNTVAIVSLANAVTVNGTLTLAGGGQLSLPDGTTSTTAYFVPSGTSQPPGTWGPTGAAAMHTNNTWFAASTGKLNVTVGLLLPALRITAASASVNGGTANMLTLYLVDQAGATLATLSGDYNFTFSGLSNAGDGTYPTVTSKTGAAVPFGTPVTIQFTAGQSTAGGSLVAYKAETATLHATDGTYASASAGGAEPSLTINNVAPVAGPATYPRNADLALRIRKSDLLTHATDANHDVLTVASVTTPSTQAAAVQASGSFINYTPGVNGNVTDTFDYTVNDGTVNSATPGTVTVTVAAAATDNTYNIASYAVADGTLTIKFAGVPGLRYEVQRTAILSPPTWIMVHWTNVPTAGLFIYTETPPVGESASFYRSVYKPSP